MDGDRFDRISRSIADRSTRRQALLRLGGGGFAASLLGLAGVRAAEAQGDAPTTCQFQFSSRVVTGPGEGTNLDGDLTITIGSEGTIDDGTFRTKDGVDYDVVGQATGRSLDMLFIDSNQGDRRISLNGVGARDVDLCRGGIRGTFGGPDVENLGTWRVSAATSNATPTPAGGGPGDGDQTPAPGAPSPTPCPPVDCGSTFVQNPQTCECDCPEPYDRCGDICCFGGADCTDPGSGACMCPPGTEPCNEVCTPSCPGGQVLDSNTCQCVTAPVEPTATTPPCPSGQDLCGGVCVSITANPNCGSCGNVCPTGIPCIGGTCQCPFGYSVCPGVGCKDLSADNDNCGSCGNVCPDGTCIAGNC